LAFSAASGRLSAAAVAGSSFVKAERAAGRGAGRGDLSSSTAGRMAAVTAASSASVRSIVSAALTIDPRLGFPSFRNASLEYIRNSMGLDGLEARAAFPRSCAAKFESMNRADKANSGR
jgi:hypothetical protein